MRKLLLAFFTLSSFALAGCESGDLVLPRDPSGPVMNLPPEDTGGGGGGGGGGEETGGGTPTPQYRLNATIGTHLGNLFDPDNYFEAVGTFERNVNGSWQRYNTSLNIVCYVNNVQRDQDSESSANHLDVEFEQAIYSGLIVRCEYYAAGGAYHETRQLVFG